MTFSEETMRMADQILEGADLGGDFIEHYGVKGQKRGVRRYQNEDGSLTDLGRRHYGIFERMRNYFSPASKGYRAAQKQKKIDEKIKYQQKVNELNRLKNESKEEEYRIKQMKRADKEERKARKFEQDIREKELESKERQFNLQQKTMLDIQKQKDNAQLAREQAQREYQTQQEIAKGKTLLGRLQKGAKLVAAVSGIAGSGKKIAEAIGIDTSKFVTEWSAKFGDDSASEKPKSEKPKTEKPKTTDTPKPDAPKSDTPQPTNQPENNRNRFRMDLSGWDPNKQYSWGSSTTTSADKDTKNKLNIDLSGWDPNKQYSWNVDTGSKDPKNKLDMDLSGWDSKKQYTSSSGNRQSAKDTKDTKGAKDNKKEETAIEQQRKRQQMSSEEYEFLKKNNISFEEWANHIEKFKHYTNPFERLLDTDKIFTERDKHFFDQDWRDKQKELKEKNDKVNQENSKDEKTETKQEAEAKAKQEALEQAKDIKRRWNNFYKFQQGSQNDSLTKSDTGRFITSTSPSKIADILLGKVPTEEYPHISLGKAMDERIGQPTDYMDEFKKRKDWQRKQRFGHDDMQEDAGEIEDAE